MTVFLIGFLRACALCHLITRSALASTFGGIVRPICLAVLRLMTLFDWKIGRLCTFENFTHIAGRTTDQVRPSRSVCHKSAKLGEFPDVKYRRQAVLYRELRDAS